MRTEIQGLKAMQQKISAMFVRLNDAVFNLRIMEAERTSSRSRMRSLTGDERPSVIQMIADAGVVVHPGDQPWVRPRRSLRPARPGWSFNA